jgi:radical SAM protein with 4Fe4S-binding SPASM domain
MNTPPLRLIALEVTRTCPLSCLHCRGDSRHEEYTEELTFAEIRAILENTAAFASPILIITGGEPLTRPDVYEIAHCSRSLGFRTVLATCGQFLDDVTVKRLLAAGVSRISVSLDGASAETHDRFRGVPGAFQAAVRGLAAARRGGLEFQVNSTLTALNIDELESLHTLAVSLGAAGFHPFLLVPMGRGKGLSNWSLSPEAYETTLKRIARIAAESPIEIKPTCSPHYIRVAGTRLRNTPPDDAGEAPGQNRRGAGMTKGCLGGQGFVFISHRGIVQICGFLDCEAGNLRETNYDLKGIWESSPLFTAVRDTERYHGKCGYCEYNRVCGGCRARAYALSGDYLGEEPNCTYQPGRKAEARSKKPEGERGKTEDGIHKSE